MPQVVNPAPSAPLAYFKNNQQIQVINDAVALTASQAEVTVALGAKANQADVTVALGAKANQVDVDDAMNLKVARTEFDLLSSSVDSKANQSYVTALDISIGTKAENTDLNNFIAVTSTGFGDVQASLLLKADIDYVASAVDTKADTSALITALGTKVDVSVANARIAEEKKFYNALSSAMFIPGSDGISEFDWNLL